MEVTKMLVCMALAVILVSQCIVARPHDSALSRNVEALVQDIDNRLIRSETKARSRRRRHVQGRQIAIMEFCLRHRYRCRQRLEELMQGRNRNTVILIEK